MAEVVRKAGLAIKVAKKDLSRSTESQVEEFLRSNVQNAYTVNGILVELFRIDPKDLRGPWSAWPGRLPILYGRVRRVLDRLYASGKVAKAKQGKALFWGSKVGD